MDYEQIQIDKQYTDQAIHVIQDQIKCPAFRLKDGHTSMTREYKTECLLRPSNRYGYHSCRCIHYLTDRCETDQYISELYFLNERPTMQSRAKAMKKKVKDNLKKFRKEQKARKEGRRA